MNTYHFLDTTDRFSYAANVVPQTLKLSPPACFWFGRTTCLVRFLDIFAWRTIWVSLNLASAFVSDFAFGTELTRD